MGARASGGPLARAGLLLLLLLLLLLGLLAPGAQGARGRGGAEKNSYRRTVNTFSQSVSSLFGEDNVRAAQKFLARLTERFVLGVDMFVETLWKVWTELLDVLGLDGSFSPEAWLLKRELHTYIRGKRSQRMECHLIWSSFLALLESRQQSIASFRWLVWLV
ncbi:BRI3-binding protein isoform X1 [Homo sapiens]|uniref:BRI3-binding protein isoform X1 n=1 Tax=Homo sapiens TaxID=9606 RepID=UPI0005CFF535|nr:BRI3-binding protein isoform X1 [Homo sapiens]XP_054227117.1 BRI3-binding protein isoform X1 [Homo sapiens]|eukprot:XP_011536242.1 BRI3-binding protein isoform X1 [Homo sapiens]